MHIWLLGALPPDPHQGSAPGHYWGLPSRRLRVHPTSKPWLRHWATVHIATEHRSFNHTR